jgi:HAD superfamily hydrolase (TIGR01490 family)
MILAVFDLDGTLISGSVLEGLIHHHRGHRTNRLPLYVFIGSHMLLWPWVRLGLVPEAWAREMWASHMGWPLRGWTPERAAQAFTWIAEQYVAPRVDAEVLARLREHERAGHRVILLSGTPSPLLDAIGQSLGISDSVGTPLIVRNGRYTGASLSPACQGAHKVTRLKQHLSEAANGVDWAHSFAYADSHTDIPVLACAGHPVAVHPDPRLAAHAESRKWEIITTQGGDR